MERYFGIAKNDFIVIYGMGTQGQQLYHILKENGFCNFILVDKRADEKFIIDNITVKPLEYLDQEETKNMPVLIGVHDSWQQDEIIEMLLKKGLTKIIGIPLKKGKEGLRVELRKIYNSILDGHIKKLDRIPFFSEEDTKDREKIKAEEDYISIWMDTIYLFSITQQYAYEVIHDNYYKDLDKKKKEITDVSVFGHPVFEVFFYFLYGNIRQSEIHYSYIIKKHTAYNYMSEEDFWEERKKLFNFYCEELKHGMQYFIENPLDVRLNKKRNRINILDGNHRLTFLAAYGYPQIPVRMRREDYNSLKKVSERLNQIVLKDEIPNILNNEFEISRKYMDILLNLYGYLRKKKWREWSFLILGDIFLAQHLSKEEVDLALVTEKEEVVELNKALDIGNMEIIQETDFKRIEKKYDCTIICSKKINDKKLILEALKHCTKNCCIWYGGEGSQKEKMQILNQTDFKKYSLQRYYWEQSQECEWGVFEKESNNKEQK